MQTIRLKPQKSPQDGYEKALINRLKPQEAEHDLILWVQLDWGTYQKRSLINITLHYLPLYSPNLNPIERFWKVMNKNARNSLYFSTTKEFIPIRSKFTLIGMTSLFLPSFSQR